MLANLVKVENTQTISENEADATVVVNHLTKSLKNFKVHTFCSSISSSLYLSFRMLKKHTKLTVQEYSLLRCLEIKKNLRNNIKKCSEL